MTFKGAILSHLPLPLSPVSERMGGMRVTTRSSEPASPAPGPWPPVNERHQNQKNPGPPSLPLALVRAACRLEEGVQASFSAPSALALDAGGA